MKYQVTLTAIGDFALQLLQTRGNLIIFDKDVPYSYENVVVSHTKGKLNEDVQEGDTLVIAEREYQIARVGANANANLRAHGHVTLHFEQEDLEEDVQPGEILVIGRGVPRIVVNDTLEIR